MEPTFQKQLEDIVNVRVCSIYGFVEFLLFRNFFFYKRAKKVAQSFQHSDYFTQHSSREFKVTIVPYNGTQKHVHLMQFCLIKNLKDDLFGVCLHGSLGNYEETAYSDFDALVILKDEVVGNVKRLANVAQELNCLRKVMLEMDPLQHHGWFVISEKQLNDYDETYFPSELFRYSKNILNTSSLSFSVFVKEQTDYKKPFDDLCISTLQIIEKNMALSNLYVLKNLLSRFMLLPSLYYQYKNKKSIFKKYSFDEIRKNFTKDEWNIMDEISAIRMQWPLKINNLRKKVLVNFYFLHPKLLYFIYPSVPNPLKKKFNSIFLERMKEFVAMLRK